MTPGRRKNVRNRSRVLLESHAFGLTVTDADAIVFDGELEPITIARAAIVIRPPSARGMTPCRTAFSTSGCSTKIGTSAARAVSSIRHVTWSRSAKRICWISPGSDEEGHLGAGAAPRSAAQRPAPDAACRRAAPACAWPWRMLLLDDQHRDRIEGVEKEVRMELHAQRAEPSLGELGGQARRLRVTLTRFDEVGERVHASEHREVHEHRPRNAREEPADVVVGRKTAEQVAEEHAERRPIRRRGSRHPRRAPRGRAATAHA